jgi:glycine/D-amino acid oxidase-like deaminating enzyme
MSLQTSADSVVFGRGVMRTSTLHHLAAKDNSEVFLLEKEDLFGQGAAGRCTGGDRYQFSSGINIRLSLESLPMPDRFKDELRQDIDYPQYGLIRGPISWQLISMVTLDDAYKALDVTKLDLDRFEESRLVREYNVL